MLQGLKCIYCSQQAIPNQNLFFDIVVFFVIFLFDRLLNLRDLL